MKSVKIMAVFCGLLCGLAMQGADMSQDEMESEDGLVASGNASDEPMQPVAQANDMGFDGSSGDNELANDDMNAEDTE